MGLGFKIALIGLFIPIAAAAQFFPENDILFEHRLPGRNQDENSITCFLQDREGFLWIGTKGGLFTYDGYEFHLFKMNPGSGEGLSNSYIRCLHEHSSREVILIGTDAGGLNILDKKTGNVTRLMHDVNDTNSISHNTVYDIAEDGTGRVWVATLGGGLNSFIPGDPIFRKHLLDSRHPESAANIYITCLYFDQDQHLLAGTKFSGLYRFDPDLSEAHPVTDSNHGVILKEIWSITSDTTGAYWTGTQFAGICKITLSADEKYTIEQYGKDRGFLNKSVITIYRDRKGCIWAGSWAGGLYRYNRETDRFSRHRHSQENALSLSGDHVLAVMEDNAGTLWIGTHAKGINLIQPGRWKFYPHTFTVEHNYGWPVNEVRSIVEQDAILWLGTSQGLMKIDTRTGACTHFGADAANDTGLLHNAVNSICEGETSRILWLGTPVGLTQMNTKTSRFRHYTAQMMVADAPLNINIYTIYKDTDSILWIGTARIGLVRFDPRAGTFRIFSPASTKHDPVTPWLVRDIIEAAPDTLLLGTSEGLYRFNTRTLQFIPFPQAHPLRHLAGRNITVLHREGTGSLWIGTDDFGLIACDTSGSALLQFTEQQGLGSNNIRGIMDDGNGTLYISTDNCISSRDAATGAFRNYYIEDGLHGTEFWNLAITRNADGKIYFGGIGGFTSLDPGAITNNPFIPPVYITSFSPLQSRSPMTRNMMYTSHIELTHTVKSFTIGFVALNFINPHDNRYQYTLEGLDLEWHSAQNNRDVTYRNITPGHYTFRVKGSNNDGVWNEAGDTLSIYVRPAFWQTSFFQIVCCTLMLAALFLLVRRRFRMLKQESFMRRLYTHSLIRSQEQERKRIASELHDSLGQDLLVIKNRVAMMLKKEKGRGNEVTHLQQISAIADDTISHIRQISFNLHPYQLEKIGLTDALKSMINKINDVSDITFSYRIEPIDGILEKELEINFYRILQELVNNIIKHSRAQSARIAIDHEDSMLTLYIEDDGIGIDYKTVNTETYGFGLSGIKERIEILKGEMSIESGSGTGTRFTITIPLRKE
ncbi:hypothetical protein JXO52_02090 [bacterium]|nr:hypothetical protein [bacterium]